MWKKNLDDDRIIALDDMPGWDKVKADTNKEGAIIAPTVINPEGTTKALNNISNKLNITLQGRNLNITVPQAGHTSIAIFDMLGHKVANLAKGNMPAGSLQFNLDGFANGNYIVRAKNGTASYAQRIRVK
jgi:mannan endo-1,4-beta-mannosidase